MSKFEFKMPKLGESITEAAIITWFKSEGDTVEKDEMLLEVATDKVDSEVPSTVSGVISELKYQANEVIKIGEVIAVIDTNGIEQEGPKKKKEVKPKKEHVSIAQSKKRIQKTTSEFTDISHKNNKFFTPLIENIAKTHHISYDELARIPASGKQGRLRKSDLFNYIKQGRPYKFAGKEILDDNVFRLPQLNLDKGKGRHVEMDRMRRMIADHMVYSKHTSPHVTAYVEADLTELVKWRNEFKADFQKRYNQKLTFTPLFIEAVAKAIEKHPMINVSVDGQTIIVKDRINIGMATALPNGNLIVPVVKDANLKNLPELAEKVNSLAEQARTNNLKADDIKGGTFTISNVGTFGSVMGTPIINQPEVAILAFGIIKKRAEVIETSDGDEIAIRQIMYLSLSFDHRVVDGYLGGSFLRSVADNLEQFDKNRTIS
ncbi:MAG: 2-oxo acid dehydrogenase subunit E2 [Flavobacteriaceae bacterium]|nr:2-oxo acid dehydrogenase subunit E2 [Flavobacteriaceae bacterium]